MVICPTCGYENDDDAQWCANCHRYLEPALRAEAESVNQAPDRPSVAGASPASPTPTREEPAAALDARQDDSGAGPFAVAGGEGIPVRFPGEVVESPDGPGHSAADHAVPDEAEPRSIICPNPACRLENPSSRTFCRRCGTELAAPPVDPPPPLPQPSPPAPSAPPAPSFPPARTPPSSRFVSRGAKLQRSTAESGRQPVDRQRAARRVAVGTVLAVLAGVVAWASWGMVTGSKVLEVETVRVVADQEFTPTGIRCTQGRAIAVTATGRVVDQISRPDEQFSPDGVDDPVKERFNRDGLVGNAIALAGVFPDGEMFIVGSEWSHTCQTEGELVLFVNDRNLANNAGFFLARIVLSEGGNG